MRSTILTLLLAATLPLTAQQLNNTEKTLSCDDGSRRWNGDRQQRFCEMRELPLAGVSRISVDGRKNGGISIKGWDRSDILVRAQVTAWANSASEATTLAGQVNVQTGAGLIEATGPDSDGKGYAVTYEIFVPHRTGLALKSHNGGIAIADVTGEVNFDAQNGGVALKRLGGNVTGTTTNGGLSIELMGDRWDGQQLNVKTTNGGVSMQVPDNYSARLETATVNGRINVDFPVTVQGRINLNRELAVNLGSGGALIRAVTTNGGVSVKRKS